MEDKVRDHRPPFALFWDRLMVYLALVNVALIVFDLSYLHLRSFYLRHLPELTSFFDGYKGIRPHPQVERYLRLVDGLGAPPEATPGALAELDRLGQGLSEENPFADTHRPLLAEALRLRIQGIVGESTEAGLGSFWDSPPAELPERQERFDAEIRPLLASTYARDRSPVDGRPVDRVWLLDLPFLCFFAAEFLVAWAIAQRRRRYRKWYHFPLVRWYDVVGLIPYFRVFRLFRLVPIYLRLHRSQATRIGQDLVSRAGHGLTRIVSEEVTTLVALRLLDQVEEEIRQGTHRSILTETLAPRRNEIRDRLIEAIRDVLGREDLQSQGREFLQSNLHAAFDHATALQGLPFSDALLKPMVATVGDAVMAALLETVNANLETPEGRESLERTGDILVDALFANLDEQELIELVEDVILDVLLRTRDAVAVKKWQESG